MEKEQLKQFMSSKTEIKNWLIDKISKVTETKAEDVEIDKDIESFGLDSIMAIRITGELSEAINYDLDPSLFFSYSTIEALECLPLM